MAVYFNVNGSGFKGGRVPAVEAGLIGFYVEGVPYKPDHDAVRALVPAKWRKAFDSSGNFWWPKEGNAGQAYMALTDTKGRRLTTIYANAQQEA